MIFAGLIYYNDGPSVLEHSIRAAHAAGLKVIAIDGAFKEFLACGIPDGFKYYSTDGCLETARQLADLHIEAPIGGWEDQASKRTRYFRETPIGDFVFTYDSDEAIRPCIIDQAVLTEDVYRIMLCPEMFSSVRLYRVFDDLIFKYQHCRTYRAKQHEEGKLDSGMVAAAHTPLNAMRKILLDSEGKQVWFDHYRDERPQWRKDLKVRFYESRREKQYGY